MESTAAVFPAGRVRLRGVLVAAPCWALLVVAWWLNPRPEGYGTHEEMGLPPCSFLVRTRLPCPSCGLTTSMSAAAHGEVVTAFLAQPFGLAIFVVAAAVAAAGTFELVTAHSVLHRLRPRWWWLAVGAGALAGGWAIKLLIGFASGELPFR